MDSLSAGTLPLLLKEKGETYRGLSSAATPTSESIPPNSSIIPGTPRLLDGFPSESLDGFDRNDWMLSIGISG
jgi:hypothetical protein